MSLKKIALIGPESTGKTTLCKELAAYYQTEWVPEFARAHVASLNRDYMLEDIEYCAREQLRSEEELSLSAHKFLFCDSELIIAKVWCEDVFKKTPAWIEEMITSHTYDLFLLTLPDIPFKPDAVRENPHRRQFFFDWYKRELDNRNFMYEIIGGTDEQRFASAQLAIRKHFPA
jgi:NadR type nicotinamide-nucleotide adenylyltransferase